MINTNTASTGQFQAGDIIEIRQNHIVGLPVTGESWFRADIEVRFGFLLGWYENGGNGSNLDFHMGYDRLAQGAGQWVDYLNYGLRIAAIGQDELIALEAEEVQDSPQVSRTLWTAGVRFFRINNLPAHLQEAEAEHQAATPGVPKYGRAYLKTKAHTVASRR